MLAHLENEASQLGALSPTGSVLLGVLVGLVATSVQSVGLTLQRKSHLLEDDAASSHPRRPPHRRRRWQLGMLMFIVSNVLGSTIQITTLPLPVLSTLQASGLVFNAICATLILGEPFTLWSLGGTTLVCIGAVLIATFGAMKEPAHTLDQLLSLLGRRTFLGWMAAQTALVVCILVFAKLVKVLDPKSKHNPRKRRARGIAYGCVSGILSAHTLLIAKSAVELIVRSVFDRANQFNRWQSWMILLGLILFALAQLYYLHCGLRLCSTSILYPLCFCVYNITAILDGLIYFQQTSRIPHLYAALIALGTAILLSGVFALSWRLEDQHQPRLDIVDPTVVFADDPTKLDGVRVAGLNFLVDESSVYDVESEPLLRDSRFGPRSRRENEASTANGKDVSRQHRVFVDPTDVEEELDGEDKGVGFSRASPSKSWRRASMPLPQSSASSLLLHTPYQHIRSGHSPRRSCVNGGRSVHNGIPQSELVGETTPLIRANTIANLHSRANRPSRIRGRDLRLRSRAKSGSRLASSTLFVELLSAPLLPPPMESVRRYSSSSTSESCSGGDGDLLASHPTPASASTARTSEEEPRISSSPRSGERESVPEIEQAQQQGDDDHDEERSGFIDWLKAIPSKWFPNRTKTKPPSPPDERGRTLASG